MAAHGKSFARREVILPTRVLDTFGLRIARKRAVLVPGSIVTQDFTSQV
jgi:hypothetical protein